MSVNNSFCVIKRNGNKEEVSFDKVTRRLKKLCNGLSDEINPIIIAQKVCSQIYNNVSTVELDELAAQICISMETTHLDYGILASRIIISNNHKCTSPSFSETIYILYNDTINNINYGNHLIADDVYEIVMKNKDKLNAIINYEKDFLFDYFGFKTLEKAYLMRVGGKVIERIQHLFMRVSIGIHKDDLKSVIQSYELISDKYFTHATPSLYNAGTPRPQFASCFLLGMDDSVKGIYKTVSDCAEISACAGGIGLSLSKIRSKNSYIKGTNGYSNGIIPLCRVLNETARHINQSGKRPGSIAVYIEPHNAEILEFLELRKNTGAESERARDLFLALWISDLFMKRVEADAEWSLFDANECLGLEEVYGDEFEALYIKYEESGKARKKISARKVWNYILTSQIETGTPYILYKDAINKKSNQKNYGTIKNSNLCVVGDTLILTDKGNIAIGEYVNESVNVWNGEVYSETVIRKTGSRQEIIKVGFSNGSFIECTKYHKFYVYEADLKTEKQVNAEDLVENMQIITYKLPSDNGFKHVEYFNVSVSCVINNENNKFADTYCFTEPLLNRGIFNGILAGNCAEILEYSDDKEYAVCTLASISLPNFVSDNGIEGGKMTFDFDKLIEVSNVVVRNLNKVIDVTYYPVPETEYSNKKHRPQGVGIQGLSDVYCKMGIAFDSPEAKALNKQIFETLYFGAMTASNNIAIEEGKPYSTFTGSPLSHGQFQFDLWGVKPSSRYDWQSLRESVMKHGVANSLLIALMPTASTSQILGNNECFEPFTSNMYTRRTMAGDFIVINKYLVRDLMKFGLWNIDMKNKIIANNGSVQNISEIPQNVRDLYKTVWEIKQKILIEQAIDRGPFICQTQSMNLFFEEPTQNMLTSALFYGWKGGLKTGCYYIRTKPKAQAQQFTIAPSAISGHAGAVGSVRAGDGDSGCEMCSA
jgi:ribonucleotide reductase alpha subunit